MTIRWFGKDNGSALHRECPQIPVPAGVLCAYCEEKIDYRDDGFMDAGGMIFHRECFLRMLCGSIAHQKKRCSCYNSGECDEWPENLSRRQEAREAVDYFEVTRK